MLKNKTDIFRLARRIIEWSESHLPWGLRSVLGSIFFVLGLFGFLPILGFWMIPLGIALIILDVPRWRNRMKQWMDERSAQNDA